MIQLYCYNLIQHGAFQDCSRMVTEEGQKDPSVFLKCYTYPIVMKHGTVIPYLKKIQKIYTLWEVPLEFPDTSIFHQKSTVFIILAN